MLTMNEAFENELNQINGAYRKLLEPQQILSKQQEIAYKYIDELVNMYKRWNDDIPNVYDRIFKIAGDLAKTYNLDISDKFNK